MQSLTIITTGLSKLKLHVQRIWSIRQHRIGVDNSVDKKTLDHGPLTRRRGIRYDLASSAPPVDDDGTFTISRDLGDAGHHQRHRDSAKMRGRSDLTAGPLDRIIKSGSGGGDEDQPGIAARISDAHRRPYVNPNDPFAKAFSDLGHTGAPSREAVVDPDPEPSDGQYPTGEFTAITPELIASHAGRQRTHDLEVAALAA